MSRFLVINETIQPCLYNPLGRGVAVGVQHSGGLVQHLMGKKTKTRPRSRSNRNPSARGNPVFSNLSPQHRPGKNQPVTDLLVSRSFTTKPGPEKKKTSSFHLAREKRKLGGENPQEIKGTIWLGGRHGWSISANTTPGGSE